MNNNIVLIDPGFLGEYGIGKWGESYWATAINHGVTQISAVLKKDGFNVSLIDMRNLGTFSDFENAVEEKESLWFCFTCRTIDVPLVNRAIKIIKQKKPMSKIIVGGVHPSLNPDYFMENNLVDYVFVGEADVTLPKLLKEDKLYNKLVKGEVPDINTSPIEDIEIYDYKKSTSFSLYGGIVRPPMIPIITSRGCVYNCKFCQPAEQIIYGKKYRQKSVERVVEEVKFISQRYDFNSIMFYDDCLLAHPKYLFELLKNIKEFKNVDVMLQGRANNICSLESQMKDLKDLGLRVVIVGFESGSQRILDFIGKGTTVEQNVKSAEILHKNGIKIVGNFMIGLPTETNEEMSETISIAEKIKATISSCSFYSPMPGSYLYEYCRDSDLIIEKDLGNLSRDPREPKIKGVDYNFASEALYRIVGSRFGNPVIKKLVGYAYKNLARGPIREILSNVYHKLFK